MLRRKRTIVLMCVVLFTVPVSCTSLEDVKAAMGFVEEAETHIKEQKNTLAFMEGQLLDLDAKLLTMPEGPEKEKVQVLRNELSNAVSSAVAVLTELELSLLTVREAVLQAEYPEDVIAPVSKRIGTFLPPPWDFLVTFIGGTVAICITGVRAANAKKAAKQIVVGIENAKIEDVVKLSEVKMGQMGKDLVDAVQATTVVKK